MSTEPVTTTPAPASAVGDRAKALLAEGSPLAAEDKRELAILYKASITSAQAYSSEATAAKLRDWEAARTALAETLARVEAALSTPEPENPATVPDPGPEGFSSLRQAVQWLIAQGEWQVSQSGVYKHAKEGKLPRPGRGKNYTLKSIKKYAARYLPRTVSGAPAETEAEALQETKLREQISLISEQRQKLERQKEVDLKRWFPVSDLEMEIAARAAVMLTGLHNLVELKTPQWIAACTGDQAQRAALSAIIWKDIAAILADYARVDEYQVVTAAPKTKTSEDKPK